MIRKLSRENPLWDAERIRDTVCQLRYDPAREYTIRNYMIRSTKPCSIGGVAADTGPGEHNIGTTTGSLLRK